MVEAYILINIKPGKEKEILNIKDESVKILEVNITYGDYDALMKVSAETLHELRKFVMDILRSKDFVEKTNTLIIAP